MSQLNALSPIEKRNFSYQRGRFILNRFLWLFLCILFFLTALLLPSYFLTVFQAQNLNQQLDNQTKDSHLAHAADIARTIDLSNAETRSLETRLTTSKNTVSKIERLAGAATNGVSYTHMEVTESKNSVRIEGFATERTALLATIVEIRKLDFVSDIQSPISNIVKESNISFVLTLKLK